MLFNVILGVHVIVCVLLTIVVLMQSSKGGALSAAFGGGGSQIFGGRETATFLSKATTYLAVLFMLTSLSLAFVSAGRGGQQASSALRRAATQTSGTVAPEDQKNIQDVLGNVPQPGQEGQKGDSGEQKSSSGEQKPQESSKGSQQGGK
jgi:preprotein translocase subunit SecG